VRSCRLRRRAKGLCKSCVGKSHYSPSHPAPPADNASRLKFKDAFAFGAPRVIGHQVGIWMISDGDRVIVAGMNSASCISSLLYASNLGRQTSVLYLNHNRKTGKLMTARYMWEHKAKRPNTHTYPVSCQVCNRVRCWGKMKKSNGKSFDLKCGGTVRKDGRDVACPGTYNIGPRPPTTPLECPYIGRWLTCSE